MSEAAKSWICTTCGTQYEPAVEPPQNCPICEDERQFVNWHGQEWTTIEQLQRSHNNLIKVQEAGIIGIGTTPKFAIGQRALLVQTAQGNLLWDCISLIDDPTAEAVKALGGIFAIAISHPHYYSSMVEWSERFGNVPIYLHADDRRWVVRPSRNIVFWGTDPAARYPRYASRYAPEPAGLFVPDGRRSRRLVSVDVGDARGPAEADTRIRIHADQELDAIAALRAVLAGRPLGGTELDGALADLARTLTAARYVAIVYDAEPGALPPEPARAESLTALGQQLNAVTRACVTPLRGGGNRVGAESVLAWQTGYPMTVDFSRGHPRFRPDDGAGALVASGAVDAVLVVGRALGTPFAIDAVRSVAIGPSASELPCDAAIDTGVAGIHESGTAFRMDDIPLPLRAPVPGPPVAADVMRALAQRIHTRRSRRS